MSSLQPEEGDAGGPATLPGANPVGHVDTAAAADPGRESALPLGAAGNGLHELVAVPNHARGHPHAPRRRRTRAPAWAASFGVGLGEAELGAHDPRVIGDPLDPTCSDCVAQICDMDPACCTSDWDQQCVDKVTTLCGGGDPNVFDGQLLLKGPIPLGAQPLALNAVGIADIDPEGDGTIFVSSSAGQGGTASGIATFSPADPSNVAPTSFATVSVLPPSSAGEIFGGITVSFEDVQGVSVVTAGGNDWIDLVSPPTYNGGTDVASVSIATGDDGDYVNLRGLSEEKVDQNSDQHCRKDGLQSLPQPAQSFPPLGQTFVL